MLGFFQYKIGKKILLFQDLCPHFPRPFAMILFACLSIFSACRNGKSSEVVIPLIAHVELQNYFHYQAGKPKESCLYRSQGNFHQRLTPFPVLHVMAEEQLIWQQGKLGQPCHFSHQRTQSSPVPSGREQSQQILFPFKSVSMG